MKIIETIRAPIRDTALTDEGFLIVKATPIARTGVFPYMTFDGKSMQAKLPDDLLSNTTVLSAQGKAVTNNHPPVSVTADNFKQYSVGVTMDDAKAVGDKLQVTVQVMDAQAIRDVESGKRELSIGFSADIVEKNGIFDGQKFDHVQKNIRINHVAIVDKGRAGSEVALKTDSVDENIIYLIDEDVEKKEKLEDSKMKNVKIGDKMIDLTAEDAQDQITSAVQAACDSACAKSKNDTKSKGIDSADAALAMATSYKADLEKANGKIAVLEKQNEKFVADAADVENTFDKRVQERVELEKSARKVLGDSAEMPKTEKEIKIAVIKHINKNIELADEASDAFIDGAYSIAVTSTPKTPNVDIAGVKTIDDAANDVEKLRIERHNLKK
jgi:hypothetical protein